MCVGAYTGWVAEAPAWYLVKVVLLSHVCFRSWEMRHPRSKRNSAFRDGQATTTKYHVCTELLSQKLHVATAFRPCEAGDSPVRGVSLLEREGISGVFLTEVFMYRYNHYVKENS